MDHGATENAVTRWLQDSMAALFAQGDPTQTLADWAADGFRFEDRTPLHVIGDRTGEEGIDAMEGMWRSNFDLGRAAVPTQKMEVVACHGERLALVRLEMGSEFFDATTLWIFELDSSLTKLRRAVQFDGEQQTEALDVFDELRHAG